MRDDDFLLSLEKRAQEQGRLMRQMPLRNIFVLASLWLGKHPWRILIPLAFLLTFFLRLLFGHAYDELILWIFGGI